MAVPQGVVEPLLFSLVDCVSDLHSSYLVCRNWKNVIDSSPVLKSILEGKREISIISPVDGTESSQTISIYTDWRKDLPKSAKKWAQLPPIVCKHSEDAYGFLFLQRKLKGFDIKNGTKVFPLPSFMDVCAIDRNAFVEPSITELANPSPSYKGHLVVVGKCLHAYHADCILRWEKTRPSCPLDNVPWEPTFYEWIGKYGADPTQKIVEFKAAELILMTLKKSPQKIPVLQKQLLETYPSLRSPR